MDQPKFDRLLRLMMMLTGNNTWTIQELASRFELTARSVYRYIDTFREAGFVIKKQGNIYRIDKSSPYFRDISSLVHFTEEEAYILKSAIENIDENNLIKQNLKKKLYTVYNYKILADTIVKGKNAAIVSRLIEAIEEKRQVVLVDYSSANGHDVRDRLVEPISLTTNYIQVWVYEPDSGQNKLFKLSRINEVKILPEQWKYEEMHREGMMDIFRISSPQRLPVKLKLGLRAVNLLREEYPLSEKYLTQLKDNYWMLDTEVCSFEGIGRFVIGLMNEVEIIESQPFALFVTQRIDEYKARLMMHQAIKKNDNQEKFPANNILK